MHVLVLETLYTHRWNKPWLCIFPAEANWCYNTIESHMDSYSHPDIRGFKR